MHLTIGTVGVHQVDGALAWEAGLAIDADGSPHAYAPAGSMLPARDYLANAGRSGHWWGVVTDNGRADGEPILQGAGDPAPGYLVSPTALVDKTRHVRDPRRYVDSDTVPYLAVPRELREQGGVRMGDVALVAYWPSAKLQAAIVADAGPAGKLGEGSIALAERLGIPSSAKDGGASRHVAAVLWPGSRREPRWPRTAEDIEAQVADLLASWGGVERLRKVLAGAC